MANFNSVELGGTRSGARTYPVSGVGLGGRTNHGARGEYTILAALAINDTIQLFDLPPRARVVSGFIKSGDLDTNGAPTITFNVGDADDPDRFFAASTVGQTGTASDTLAATGYDFVTTKKTRVYLTVLAGPATGATTGTIVVVLNYWVDEPI